MYPLRHMKTHIVRIALLVLALTFTAHSAMADDYSFSVHNNTRLTIKKILVSEDGEEWGYFDIGKGIRAGQTIELVWDSSTNGESCEQFFKAVFSDNEESEPTKFDFCEPDMTLEFE